MSVISANGTRLHNSGGLDGTVASPSLHTVAIWIDLLFPTKCFYLSTDVPNAPTNLVADCTSRRSERLAVITWRPPRPNQSPITTYKIQYATSFQPGLVITLLIIGS